MVKRERKKSFSARLEKRIGSRKRPKLAKIPRPGHLTEEQVNGSITETKTQDGPTNEPDQLAETYGPQEGKMPHVQNMATTHHWAGVSLQPKQWAIQLELSPTHVHHRIRLFSDDEGFIAPPQEWYQPDKVDIDFVDMTPLSPAWQRSPPLRVSQNHS